MNPQSCGLKACAQQGSPLLGDLFRQDERKSLSRRGEIPALGNAQHLRCPASTSSARTLLEFADRRLHFLPNASPAAQAAFSTCPCRVYRKSITALRHCRYTASSASSTRLRGRGMFTSSTSPMVAAAPGFPEHEGMGQHAGQQQNAGQRMEDSDQQIMLHHGISFVFYRYRPWVSLRSMPGYTRKNGSLGEAERYPGTYQSYHKAYVDRRL